MLLVSVNRLHACINFNFAWQDWALLCDENLSACIIYACTVMDCVLSFQESLARLAQQPTARRSMHVRCAWLQFHVVYVFINCVTELVLYARASSTLCAWRLLIETFK